MKAIEYSEADKQGLAQALTVARSGVRSHVSEDDEKLLGFFLRHGECDARIAVPLIEVRFSWLQKRKPSTYFGALAPVDVGWDSSQHLRLGGTGNLVPVLLGIKKKPSPLGVAWAELTVP